LQKEVDELAKEITRISNDTEFNTQKLLDGTFQGSFHIGANEGQNITLNIGAMDAVTLGVASGTSASAASLQGGDITSILDTNLSATSLTLNGQTVRLTNVNALDGSTKAFTVDNVVNALQSDINAVFDGTANGGVTFTVGKTADGNGLTITSNKIGTDVTITANADSATLKLTSDSTTNATAKTTAATVTSGINISTQGSAESAITLIDTAINSVSTQRSTLGAYQNRLEHTINNLGTSSQNLTAAESRIRDVDMAKEMAEFTKNNILNQAAQAMLAQANNLPQGVLQLLK
jgi:flagellin